MTRTGVIEICQELESLGMWTIAKQISEHDEELRKEIADLEEEVDRQINLRTN